MQNMKINSICTICNKICNIICRNMQVSLLFWCIDDNMQNIPKNMLNMLISVNQGQLNPKRFVQMRQIVERDNLTRIETSEF